MRAIVIGGVLAGVFQPAAAGPATRDSIEKAVAAAPHRLRKSELRPTMKQIMPRVQRCYEAELQRTPKVDGVVNTKLTIRNAPGLGLVLSVNGFETDGKLGESKAFLTCVTRTLEGEVFPPLAVLGRADLMYPMTFATIAPSARDKAVVDRAERAAKAGNWTAALDAATSGLKLTSLEGPLRRHLIELGGVAACHLRDISNARRYYALVSPEYEVELETTCAAESIDLAN